MTKALIACIRSYQRISRACAACGLTPLTISGCRQWPSCSEYCITAISEHGVPVGLYKSLFRILRCNPFTQSHVH